MIDSPYILGFECCDAQQHARVGGKCASLGALIQAGAPVPPGFAITTDAYRALLATESLAQRIHSLLEPLVAGDVASETAVSQSVRALVEATPMPADVEQAIRSAYAALCARVGIEDLPVAVRSSATAEDLPGASFAGQQDTFLWVVGADAVIEHTRKCWSSLFTARALAYRHDQGFAHEQICMSVAVQKMVNARTAGVAMTLNPINGDRSKVVIDASWGLGEAVVGGEVTPDNFTVDKVIFEIVGRTVSAKQIEYVVDHAARRVVEQAIEEPRQSEPSLSDAEVIAVARLARKAERFYRTPQDIEWAIDADLPAPDNIMLLQSRPETVWSQRGPSGLGKQATSTAGVLDTLLKPVQVKLGK